jgi:hypothetical protein
MIPRIAVLGCGYWGSNHIRTLKSLGALHAVSDANGARAEGFASEQECLAVDPEELYGRDDIDAIPPRSRGLSPRNPVNRPRRAGVQLELTPRVRGLPPFWAPEQRGRKCPDVEALIQALAEAVGRLP